jgi:ABC-type multidrug transport system permease subunit
MAHLFALYGWMSWHFWNHIAATVIWTLAVCFLLAYIMERAKGKKSE